MKKAKMLARKLTRLDYNTVLDFVDISLGYIELFLIHFFFLFIAFSFLAIYLLFFY